VKRTVWLIILGVLVFAGIVVARMPVSWVFPGPSSGVSCSDTDGTVWSGSCSGLTVAAVQREPLGDLTWDLHAARLLAAKLNADFVLTRPALGRIPPGAVQGNVEAGRDRNILAHDLKIDLPLDRQLASGLPPNLQGLRGQVHADLAQLRIEKGKTLKAIEGLVEIHDLTDGEGPGAARWGSYSLTFPPSSGGDPVGQIKDLGGNGPLSVEGTLKLTSEPGFDLEGMVAARPTCPPDLAQNLQYLGSPDAQGRRPFSLAATF
jgi:general secretion pathway protein N